MEMSSKAKCGSNFRAAPPVKILMDVRSKVRMFLVSVRLAKLGEGRSQVLNVVISNIRISGSGF